MRRIFVALGADITWDGETQSITVSKGSSARGEGKLGSNKPNCQYRELKGHPRGFFLMLSLYMVDFYAPTSYKRLAFPAHAA